MKKAHKRLSKKWVIALPIIILGIASILFFSFKGPAKVRKIYYGRKATAALKSENNKLGDPLKALGFSNIEGGNSVCVSTKEYGVTGTVLRCTATYKSYQVFNDAASKAKATAAAEKISALLKQNGWKQGNYELGKWFKDAMNKIDYNPDAYHYKYFGKTFCVFDFFEAYSNPKPPAVQAMFYCTTPETHPPIF